MFAIMLGWEVDIFIHLKIVQETFGCLYFNLAIAKINSNLIYFNERNVFCLLLCIYLNELK